MTPNKLIEEYQAKIVECDMDIHNKRSLIKDAADEWTHGLLKESLLILEARRQAYFQFTKDLEDLEDVS